MCTCAVCVDPGVPQHLCGGQRAAWFFPSTMWGLGWNSSSQAWQQLSTEPSCWFTETYLKGILIFKTAVLKKKKVKSEWGVFPRGSQENLRECGKDRQRIKKRKLSNCTYDSAHRSLGHRELLRHWGVLCQDLMDCCLGLAHLHRKPTDQQHSLIAYILCVHINPSACLLPQLQREGRTL